MKKLLSALVVLSLVVSASAAFAADTIPAPVNIPVNLKIDKYATFAFTDNQVDITLSDGASTGSDTVAYNAVGNFNYKVSFGWAPTATPSAGTWTLPADVTALAGVPTAGSPTVSVEGISLSNAAGTYTGTIVATIAAQ